MDALGGVWSVPNVDAPLMGMGLGMGFGVCGSHPSVPVWVGLPSATVLYRTHRDTTTPCLLEIRFLAGDRSGYIKGGLCA